MMQWRIFRSPAVAGLALVLAALPVAPESGTPGFDGAAALANPGGGNGGGHGGGHGGGKGGKSRSAAPTDRTAGPGKATSKGPAKGPGRGGRSSGRGLALGHDKDRDAVSGLGHAFGHDDDDATKHGLTASSLGRLNAAHASATAREHAAPHSAVGLIGQYADAIAAGDLEAAAAALAAAANKDIDLAVVGAVNDLLDIELDEADEQEIADLAGEAQAGESSPGLGHGGSPPDGADDADDGQELIE
jgi:hypothetical protein